MTASFDSPVDHFPQQPKRPLEDQETDPRIRFIESTYEEVLTEREAMINQGNNGVIFSLDLSRLSEDERQSFIDADIFSEEDFDSPIAIKLLKVYSGGQGRHEYEMHSRAYRSAQHADGRSMARVPRIRDYRDMEISEFARDTLKQIGVNAGNRVEVLVMEHIPGADVAELMYREIVKAEAVNRPDVNIEEVDSYAMDDLRGLVTELLSLSLPGGKGKKPEERALEAQKVNDLNREIILRYLKRRGIVFHPQIARAVEATLDAFHANGLAYRDGHERNVMIVGDHRAEAPEPPLVYVLDFGGSAAFDGDFEDREVREKLFTDELRGRRYIPDTYIVETLDTLAQKPTEVGHMRWVSITDTMKRSRKYTVEQLRAQPYIEQGSITPKQLFERAQQLKLTFAIDQLAYDQYALFLTILSEHGILTRSVFKTFLDEYGPKFRNAQVLHRLSSVRSE